MPSRPRVLSVAAPVSELIARLVLAPRQAHKALTLWPLLEPDALGGLGPPPWLALADAIAAGLVRVDELPDGGMVPHVLVENDADQAVLVLFGEELRGAKQNRVVNASVLVAPHERVVLDVSCVEMGRWSRLGRGCFGAGGSVLSSSLRRRMAKKVADSRDRVGRFHADQGEVWEQVDLRVERAGIDSRSRAYADYLESRASDLAEIGAAFRPLERQVGFVAAIADEVAGLEVVGHPAAFARVFDALLRAYVIDAVDAALVREREPAGSVRFDAPEPFLAALAAAGGSLAASLGLGQDLRLEGGGVRGCALLAGDVVHLTAFPAPEAV